MKLSLGLAAVALATTTFSATTLAAPANAVDPVQPTRLAADWIVSQLTGGVAVGDYGADVGLTIDAGLALAAIDRTADAEVIGDSIASLLVTSAEVPYGYVRSDEYDFNPPYDYVGEGLYSNATAKAAAFTQRIGRDASAAYADVNLIVQLEDLTDDTTGAIADVSIYGNYANTIGQSFAVEALTVAGSSEAARATDSLLAQQCPAGFFRLTLDATPCADATDAPNPDVTALAVISLLESGSSSAQVAAAIAGAADWLQSVQKADGSLGGDASTPGSNSNTTGLAAWALGDAGRIAAARDAAAWTRGLQASDAGACASRAPTGGIAYNEGDLTEARVEGVTLKRDAWRRATFQAAPGLVFAPAADKVLAISTPATAAEKSTVTATVGGLAAGEYGCVAFGSDARTVKGTGTDLTVDFGLPAGPASHTFSVTTLGGTRSATTTVPALTTIAPTPTPVPTPAPVVGDLAAAKVERVRNNSLKLAITCEGAAPCAGKVKVRTVRKFERANGNTRKRVLAKSTYSVEPGKTVQIKLVLTRPARALLGTKRLRVVATQTASRADTERTAFWLKRA